MNSFLKLSITTYQTAAELGVANSFHSGIEIARVANYDLGAVPLMVVNYWHRENNRYKYF